MRRSERGAVTAELALGMPLLAALTVGMVWVLAVAADQIRVVDAARETARAVARGDDPAAAVEVGSRVAPQGALIEVSVADERVTVTVRGATAGPGGLFRGTGPAKVQATAVAVLEGS